jgi:hypothetical protein
MLSVSDVFLRGPLACCHAPEMPRYPVTGISNGCPSPQLGPIWEPSRATVGYAPILHGSVGAVILKCR